MSEVQAEEEKKPFIGFMIDAECCCFSCNDIICTPIMDEALKEKGFCCTICSGANYLVKPSIFCAAREALCGYPKFAVAGSPRSHASPDASAARPHSRCAASKPRPSA